MASNLLEEAIVDAQKLRELAEQTAKNRIVEAVMPQIRELVNRRILGESVDEVDEDDVKEQDDQTESINEVEDDESDKEAKKESKDDGLVEALLTVMNRKNKESMLESRVNELAARVSKLRRIAISESIVVTKHARPFALKVMECTREAMSIKQELSVTKRSATNGSLSRRLDNSIKELREMATKNRSIFDFLFEENGSRQLKEASLSLEFGDDEKEKLGDSYDEIVSILSAAGINVAGGEEAGDEGDEDMEGMEGGEEEEGGEDEEEDMEEGYGMKHELDDINKMEESMYELDEMEEGLDELDEMEEGMDEMDEEETVEGVYEIDESVLRRELGRLRRLREAAADQAHHFGGGKVVGDVILDIDEDDLINVLADELGKYQGVAMPKVGGLKKESRARRASSINTSRERQLRESLEQARRSALQEKRNAERMKQQLMEMNLFNAKLLYANKLMQNKDLTVKQQKAIVEALDNAKTLREAKLLYDSLSESVARRASGSKNLSEGMVRPVGSASRSTRSAAPANQSGIDSDRWSVLAGLK
jgi:hypothetical protein